MSVFDDLPVLTQRTARCAPQKGASRLERKMATDRDEKAEERRWKKEVWIRDGGLDRLTGRKCRRSFELHPQRGEVHHVAPRVTKAVRWDRRNGILLAAETHERVTRHQLRIVGTKFFTVDGQRYIDCDYAVRFVKA